MIEIDEGTLTAGRRRDLGKWQTT